MPANPHSELLECPLEAEPFVSTSLRLLERQFREMALWMLADFTRTELTALLSGTPVACGLTLK